VGAPPTPLRRTVHEGTLLGGERIESSAQFEGERLGEARSDLARVNELSIVVVVPEEQGADAFARSFRFGEPANDKFPLLAR